MANKTLQKLIDYREEVRQEVNEAQEHCDEFALLFMQPVFNRIDKIIKEDDGPCTCELRHAFEDVLDEVFGVLVCLSNVITKSEGIIEAKSLVPIQNMLNNILSKYDQIEVDS